jgi:hypothetical protein
MEVNYLSSRWYSEKMKIYLSLVLRHLMQFPLQEELFRLPACVTSWLLSLQHSSLTAHASLLGKWLMNYRPSSHSSISKTNIHLSSGELHTSSALMRFLIQVSTHTLSLESPCSARPHFIPWSRQRPAHPFFTNSLKSEDMWLHAFS